MAPFFGKSVHTLTLVGKLANITNANIIFVYAIRQGMRNYRIHLEKGDDLVAISHNAPQFAHLMNQRVETIIRKHPEQYLWHYKRFRHCPNVQYP